MKQKLGIEPNDTLAHSMGYIPSPLNLDHNIGLPLKLGIPHAYLPSSYDLRTQGKLTAVRNQGDCGACWTFAAYAALESYLLPTVRDYSENNMKNTSGFDWGHCYGGNALMATAYFARYSGPILETSDPYNEFSNISPAGLTPDYHIQTVLMLTDRTSPLDTAAIKNAIMTYGAVDTSMCWEDPYYKESTRAYYYTGSAIDVNHAVAIVGWDDAYSAANFLTAPPGSGAFIVRNSWGSDWGMSGYFYASYYDPFFKGNTVFISAESVGNYLRQYSFAPLGWTWSTGYNTNTAWGAEVFKAVSKEKLASVSTYFASNGSSYEVRIYKGPPANNPSGGTLLATKTGTVATAGYHTISLADQSIPLAAGQSFSVVIKYTTPSYLFPVPIETYVPDYASSVTGSPGRAFVSSNGLVWEDNTSLVASEDNAIQAFTVADCNDGSDCTVDSWDGVKCVNTDISASCVDSNPCTDNYCAPQGGGCVVVYNALPCNDHNGCTKNDQCVAGTCAGVAIDCEPAGGGCVGAACSSSGDSSYLCLGTGVRPDGSPCNADNFGCTANDYCLSGVCKAGTEADCSNLTDACNQGSCASSGPYTYLCLLDPLPLEGAGCNADSNGCTVGDACHSGVCQPGPPVDCSSASDICNLGMCASLTPGTYACVKDPSARNGQSCNADSDGCTVGDSCLNGTCVTGTPADCSGAASTCVAGVCASTGPYSFSCGKDTSLVDGAACDDGEACTAGDTCGDGICSGTAKDCSDGIDCTIDSCNPGTGTCAREPDPTRCDESTECSASVCKLDQGCVAVPKEEWAPCGEEGNKACLQGLCESVPPGDVCDSAKDFPVNERRPESLAGLHGHPGAPDACQLSATLGRDVFYQVSLLAGWTYVFRAEPEPDLDLALALYTECDASSECIKAVNNTGAGNAEQIVKIKPVQDGLYYLMVAEVNPGSAPETSMGFALHVKGTPPPNSNPEATPEANPEASADASAQADSGEEVMAQDGAAEVLDSETSPSANDTGGHAKPVTSSGGCSSTTGGPGCPTMFWLLLVVVLAWRVRRTQRGVSGN